MKLKYRKGIFLVAYSNENKKIKYLVLKRKLHWKGWEFPKGGIEKNESAKKTIIREMKEETGLKPIIIKKFSASGKYNYDKIYPDRAGFKGQTYQLYAAEVNFGKIKLDKIEHFSYKWLGFRDVLKKLTWPDQKKCLIIVNNWLNKRK
jgi:8-oxo-dGTP pyrophosphatase MutT (NUDIX family)